MYRSAVKTSRGFLTEDNQVAAVGFAGFGSSPNGLRGCTVSQSSLSTQTGRVVAAGGVDAFGTVAAMSSSSSGEYRPGILL